MNPEVQSYKHVYVGHCTPYTSAEIKNVAAVSQGGILFIHCLFYVLDSHLVCSIH